MDAYVKSSIEIDEFTINVMENKKYGHAGKVWEGGLLLSNFLTSQNARKRLKNKVVLEIGSGTGLCGIVAALCGAKKVYLTDREEALHVIQMNFEANKQALINCEIVVVPLNWNNINDLANIKDKIDVILGSEIIYHGINYKNIINTIDYFSDKNTDILMSYKHRTSSSCDFFNILDDNKIKWSVKVLSKDYLEENEIETVDDTCVFLLKNLIK